MRERGGGMDRAVTQRSDDQNIQKEAFRICGSAENPQPKSETQAIVPVLYVRILRLSGQQAISQSGPSPIDLQDQ
jgi:hypothetical protein